MSAAEREDRIEEITAAILHGGVRVRLIGGGGTYDHAVGSLGYSLETIDGTTCELEAVAFDDGRGNYANSVVKGRRVWWVRTEHIVRV